MRNNAKERKSSIYCSMEGLSHDDSGQADSSKIRVCNGRLGLGIFAQEDLNKGEFVAGFYGSIFPADRASQLPAHVINHAIQFSGHLWRDSAGVARYLNHSCNPNCGVRNDFDIVTLRPIKAGEELVWDYATTENSDWTVPGGRCLCLSPNCRGDIPPYRNLSAQDKELVAGRISNWIKLSNEQGAV